MEKNRDPKPFPEWNSVEEFEIPIDKPIILCAGDAVHLFRFSQKCEPHRATHWMYAPEPPKPEPKRGVWVSIKDGLPPVGVEVLVANGPSDDLLRARRHPMGWWSHHSASYHESNFDRYSHWYLPHEFET